MKTFITFLISIITLVSFTSCEKEEIEEPLKMEMVKYKYADSLSNRYTISILTFELLSDKYQFTRDSTKNNYINFIIYRLDSNNNLRAPWIGGRINNNTYYASTSLYYVMFDNNNIDMNDLIDVKLKITCVYMGYIVDEKIVNLTDIRSHTQGDYTNFEYNTPIYEKPSDYENRIQQIINHIHN